MSSREKALNLSKLIEKTRRRQSRTSFQDSVDDEKQIDIDYKANPTWKPSHLCWEAKGPIAEAYRRLWPRIRDELNQSRKESSREVAISLFMVGRKVQKAKPIIIISSEDKQSSKDAREAIEKSDILADTDFELGLSRFPPSGPIRPVAMEDNLTSQPLPPASSCEAYFDPKEHVRLVGMPIYIKHGATSIRRATANAVYNGRDYGYITAAHAFKPMAPDIQPMGDEEYLEIPFDSDSDSDSGGDDDEDMEIPSQYSNTSPEATESERSSVSSPETPSSHNHSLPHSQTISSSPPERFPDRAEPSVDIQMPSIDYFSDTQYKVLGKVSSTSTSLDYVVISVTDPTVISFLEKFKDATKNTNNTIAVAKARCTNVIAWTSHGPIHGSLADTPIFMCLPSSDSYELVYKFTYDGVIKMGDCGTLVIDAETRELYGHIIADSDSQSIRVAYMVAAVQVLGDIKSAGNWQLLSLKDTERELRNVMSSLGPQAGRPPQAYPQPAQPTPQPKPAGPLQSPPQPSQSSAPNNLNKGLKRPVEDTTEANTDGPSSNIAPQAPKMVPSRWQHDLSRTKEQMFSLTPQREANLTQRMANLTQRMANLKKAQDMSSNKAQPRLPSLEELAARIKDPEREKKYRGMTNEEHKKLPQGQPVQLSPEVRFQLKQLLRETLPLIRKVEQALRIFLVSYEGGDSEKVARTVIRARISLLKQVNTGTGSLHSQVTLTETEFKQHVRHLLNFVSKIMSRVANQQAQDNVGPQNQQQQRQPPSSASQLRNPASQTPQLNSANLKTLENQHRQQKTPPAPISAQPPFSLSSTSPQGAPMYLEGAKNLTHLSLPDKKRVKIEHGSQSPTAGPKQSPRIPSGNKGSSPELKRQPQPGKPALQKPTFKCPNTDCEYAMRGFDSQVQLDAHVSHAYANVDDPLQFAIESMADSIRAHAKTGQPKQDLTSAAGRAFKTVAAAPPPLPQPVKPGQTSSMPPTTTTPAGPQAAANPMARTATQTGITSSPFTSLLKTPQTLTKVATPKMEAPARATPSSVVRQAPREAKLAVVPKPEKEEELQPLNPSSLLDFPYDEVFYSLSTNNPFTTLDLKDEDNSYALRSRPSSPLNTPDLSSSKDTPSTRQSDISETDNLNIDIKDADMPDAWLVALNGDPLPLDAQLFEDLQNLGVTLPPMDNDDMMLSYEDILDYL